MLEIAAVQPLDGPVVRLSLTNGDTVERDLTDLLRGPLFDPIARDPALFRSVTVVYGTLAWPGDVDIAPETLIWNGPAPRDESTARPAPFLRPRQPA
jgi:hypothetical protein